MVTAMDRLKALSKILEQAGAREYRDLHELESEEGVAGCALEIAILFAGIVRDFAGSHGGEWLDTWATTLRHSERPLSGIDKNVIAVADSNVDRTALTDLIRYLQA